MFKMFCDEAPHGPTEQHEIYLTGLGQNLAVTTVPVPGIIGTSRYALPVRYTDVFLKNLKNEKKKLIVWG